MLRLFTQHINKCKQGTRFRAYAKFGFIKKHGEAVDITPEPVSVPVDNQTENDLRELSANLSEGLIKRLKTQFLGGGDLKDVKRKSNETLLKMVRESHKKAGVYTSTALITIFGALLYVVVVSSYFDETKNHIQTLLATILSPQEDFALFGASSAEELSRKQTEALIELRKYCNNAYNYPLLSETSIISDLSHAIRSDINLERIHLSASILSTLSNSNIFKASICQSIQPNDIIAIIQSIKPCDAKTSLSKLLQFVVKHNVDNKVPIERDFVKSACSLVKQDDNEMRHLYTCLVHLIVRSRAYKNDPEFDAIVKNILAQYDNTEIYKVKDYVLKTNLENIIFDYHEQMNTTSRISKKKSILPDVSLYNIGHYVNIVFCIPAYVLTRYYCRMFRKGLNGPVRLMNHSLPAAYSALKLCLAISGWEFTSEMIKQHLFFDKAEPIDRKFVPLVLMLRYAPEVLLLAYSNLSNPFLILPYLIVIKGFISLTQFHLGSHLIGYEDKKSLTII